VEHYHVEVVRLELKNLGNGVHTDQQHGRWGTCSYLCHGHHAWGEEKRFGRVHSVVHLRKSRSVKGTTSGLALSR
jgi:hypothetical protein